MIFPYLNHFWCQTSRQVLFVLGLLAGTFAHAGQPTCPAVHMRDLKPTFHQTQQSYIDQFLQKFGLGNDRKQLHWYSLKGPLGGSFGNIDFDKGELANRFKFGLREYDPTRPSAEVGPITESHFTKLQLPSDIIKVQDANGRSQEYRLLNIGFRLLSKDWPFIEKAMSDGLKANPGQDLIMTFHPGFIQALRSLETFHRWASMLATNVYAGRKNYLSKEVLFDLRDSDVDSASHDDYFVLQKYSDKSPLDVNYEEFETQSLAVIRLVRFGYNSAYFPQNISGHYSSHWLPVFNRFRNTPIGRNIQDLVSDLYFLAGKNVAEISRFARIRECPEVLITNLMKNIFETAVQGDRPIDILLISVDSATRKLFRMQYKFQDLMPLTDGTDSSPEFLMYLDTKSQDFRDVLSSLQKATSNVQQTKGMTRVPKVQYRNDVPKNWNVGSLAEKQNEIENGILALREQIRRSRPNIWDAYNRNSPLPAQALEVRAGIFFGDSTVQRRFAEKYQKLSQEEKVSRQERVSLFSGRFTRIAIDIMSTLPRESDVLILGRESHLLKKLSRKDVNVDRIRTGDLNLIHSQNPQIFDRIILFWPELQRISDEEIIRHLNSAYRTLKPGGLLEIHSSFLADNDSRPLVQYDFERYFADLAWNDSRLTAEEVDMAMAAQLKNFNDANLRRFTRATITPYFQRVGFKDFDSAISSTEFYYGSSISFRKPE